MKIALVILHADPARGGAERYTIDLAAALLKRGHEVSLLASSFAATPEGVRQQKLPTTGPTRARRYLRFLDSVDTHLQSNNHDIVHAMLPVRRCDIYHPHAGVAAEALTSGHLKHAGKTSRKLSQLANRFNRRRQLFAQVERELLESATPPIALCLSEYVKATILRHFPNLPQRCLFKLFNAIDLDRFDPTSRPAAGQSVRERFNFSPDHVVGLMLAQDFQRKGLKESISALAAVSDPSLRLLVAGKQDPSGYRRLAQDAGVTEQICFAGVTNDPYAFYQAADFLILPTWHDPCSLVVLESIAMGVPVISTALNGACEIVQNGVQGYVIADPEDKVGLQQALVAIHDKQLRKRMSAACIMLRPRLSYESHLIALEKLYGRFKQFQQ